MRWASSLDADEELVVHYQLDSCMFQATARLAITRSLAATTEGVANVLQPSRDETKTWNTARLLGVVLSPAALAVNHDGKELPLLALTKRDLEGVDRWLDYLRSNEDLGGCTTREWFVLSWTREGESVLEEQYSARDCPDWGDVVAPWELINRTHGRDIRKKRR